MGIFSSYFFSCFSKIQFKEGRVSFGCSLMVKFIMGGKVWCQVVGYIEFVGSIKR